MRPTDAAPRHVLMTVDAVGGVWTYALALSRALSAYGVRVTFALMGPEPSDAQREAVKAIPGAALHESSHALEWMDCPWNDLDRAEPWLLDLERTLLPDVVHLNGYCHAACAWRAPVLAVGHSCVLSWWRAVYGSDAPAAWDEYGARVRAGLQAADLVVAPTAAMLGELEFHYGPLPRRAVIPNGCEPPEPPVRHGEAAKEPFVLTAGRLWDRAKNVESVVAVAARLSWPVYVAGDGRHPAGREVSFEGIHPLGRLGQQDLAGWMARAAIFALPVRYEPFGLSMLEAATAGCALVLGDIRTQREIWGDAAMFVPPDNRRALTVALERLAWNDDERQTLAARAAERARSFTAARMAHAYYEAYSALLRDSLPLTA